MNYYARQQWTVRRTAVQAINSDGSDKTKLWALHVDGCAQVTIAPFIQARLRSLGLHAHLRASEMSPFTTYIELPTPQGPAALNALRELLRKHENVMHGPYCDEAGLVKYFMYHQLATVQSAEYVGGSSWDVEVQGVEPLEMPGLRYGGTSCSSAPQKAGGKTALLRINNAASWYKLGRELRLIATVALLRWNTTHLDTRRIIGEPLPFLPRHP